MDRFSGTIKRIGKDFGFVRIDNTATDVFFHRAIASECLDYGSLRVGDRLTFSVKESSTYRGKLVAGKVARETKT